MEIATATYADSWGIEELLMQYQEEVVATNPEVFFHGILSRDAMTRAMVAQMDKENINMEAVRHNGKVVGFSRACVNVFFYTEVITAELEMMFLCSSIRKTLLGGRVFIMLINKFEAWGAKRGAQILGVSSISGLKYKSMNTLVEKLGYKTVGFNSMKRIED